MNAHVKNPVIIMEEDYEMLKVYINDGFEKENEMTLSSELKRAIVVNKAAFPSHAIRLGSRVSVLELTTNKVVEFTLVMPVHADIQKNKVSILTPIGAALIGFRKGEEVQWKVPAGLKRFRILDVFN